MEKNTEEKTKINKTAFLDNIIAAESCLMERIFGRSHAARKENILMNVFKIVASRELFGISNKDKNHNNTYYLQEGAGFWIYDLRRLGVKDEEVYDRIICSRDNFLTAKNLLGQDYEKILLKKQCLETYNAVRRDLIDYLQQINQNSGQ